MEDIFDFVVEFVADLAIDIVFDDGIAAVSDIVIEQVAQPENKHLK